MQMQNIVYSASG